MFDTECFEFFISVGVIGNKFRQLLGMGLAFGNRSGIRRSGFGSRCLLIENFDNGSLFRNRVGRHISGKKKYCLKIRFKNKHEKWAYFLVLFLDVRRQEKRVMDEQKSPEKEY